MYAVDLRKKIQGIESQLVVDISVHTKPVPLGRVQKSVIESRLEKDDKVFIARSNGDLVAYLFAATSKADIGEIDEWLIVGQNEVYLYDAFTVSRVRGKGIYPRLIAHASAYFKNQGCKHALIFSTSGNTASIRGIERCGFRCYETVWYRNFLGWKSWRYDVRDKFVTSRLSNED
jgi:GNAT superfamily N-acetyltransferase